MGMKKYFAEFFGTCIFIYLTVGIDVIAPKGAGLLGIGASFGLSYLILYYLFGRISGAYFNPALTIAASVFGNIDRKDIPIYIMVQIAGAIAGAFMVWIILKGLPQDYDIANYGFAQNGWGKGYTDEYNLYAAIIVELVGSFILTLVFLNTSGHLYKGVSVGCALVLIHWLGLYVTGASYNPAYSIATALVVGDSNTLYQQWLFIVIPTTGSFLAAFLTKYLEQK